MICKLLEIRDRATMIAAMAVRSCDLHVAGDPDATAARRYLLGLVGWKPEPGSAVLLVKLSTGEGHFDPFEWPNARTMQTAHQWIERHFDSLTDGQVVDVRFIVGETGGHCQSGRLDDMADRYSHQRDALKKD